MGRFGARTSRALDLHDPVVSELRAWFAERYGDRLLAQVALGRIPILIDGDIVVIRMEPANERFGGGFRATFKCKWGLEAGVRFSDSLSKDDWRSIHDLLRMGWIAFSELSPLVCERVLPLSATEEGFRQ